MTDNKPMPRKDSYLQSLEKGFAVLDALGLSGGPLTISEIAERTGQDRASARRALLTLAHLGYVRQTNRRFSLAPRTLTLGYRYLASLPFLPLAQRVIEELADELQETVSVGVLDGPDIVFVLRVPVRRFLSFDASVGSHVPAHLHSMGQTLLAAQPRADWPALLDTLDLRPFTPFSISDRDTLAHRLEAVREQGWAFTNQQYEEGYCGVAVPLFDTDGAPIAALNVSFAAGQDAERRAEHDILPRLKLAARRILQPRV